MGEEEATGETHLLEENVTDASTMTVGEVGKSQVYKLECLLMGFWPQVTTDTLVCARDIITF